HGHADAAHGLAVPQDHLVHLALAGIVRLDDLEGLGLTEIVGPEPPYGLGESIKRITGRALTHDQFPRCRSTPRIGAREFPRGWSHTLFCSTMRTVGGKQKIGSEETADDPDRPA